MEGGSADHAGAVICRHAGDLDEHQRSRPRSLTRETKPDRPRCDFLRRGLLQRFYWALHRCCCPGSGQRISLVLEIGAVF